MEIDETIMSDVTQTYSPSRYRAPLTVTHRLPTGVTERTLPYAADLVKIDFAELTLSKDAVLLSPNGLAYGAPTRLERRPDGGVDAVFDRISPCFVSWVRNGNLLSVSPGLYRPTDAGNPTPGRWSLRHIAGLGSEPPAAKGMETLALAEFGHEKAGDVNFSGSGNPCGLSVFHPLASSLLGQAAIVPSLGVALAEARRSALVLG
jgi:hypothetical protein